MRSEKGQAVNRTENRSREGLQFELDFTRLPLAAMWTVVLESYPRGVQFCLNEVGVLQPLV